jgi:hypothetical protein
MTRARLSTGCCETRGGSSTRPALLAFAVIVLLTSSAPAEEDRGANPTGGRRYLIERAERDRERQRRWQEEDDLARNRARARERQAEERMQQYRQDTQQERDEP